MLTSVPLTRRCDAGLALRATLASISPSTWSSPPTGPPVNARALLDYFPCVFFTKPTNGPVLNCIYNTMFLAALVALLQLHSAAENNRWSLVRAHPKAVIDVAESKHDGIGGFETGSFVKVVIMQWCHPSCYGTQYKNVGTAAVCPMLLVLPPRGTAGLCPPPPSACMSMFPLSWRERGLRGGVLKYTAAAASNHSARVLAGGRPVPCLHQRATHHPAILALPEAVVGCRVPAGVSGPQKHLKSNKISSWLADRWPKT